MWCLHTSISIIIIWVFLKIEIHSSGDASVTLSGVPSPRLHPVVHAVTTFVTLSGVPSLRLSPCQASRHRVCRPVRRPITASVTLSGVPSPRLSTHQVSYHRICHPSGVPSLCLSPRQASRHRVCHPVGHSVTAPVAPSGVPSPRLSPCRTFRHRACRLSGVPSPRLSPCRARRHRACHPVGHPVTASVAPSGVPGPARRQRSHRRLPGPAALPLLPWVSADALRPTTTHPPQRAVRPTGTVAHRRPGADVRATHPAGGRRLLRHVANACRHRRRHRRNSALW